jgi:ABC-2 type transport system ATP-binding protein
MIHAQGLARTFHTKRGRERAEVKAVDGVDIDVEEGEIVGFLGPNGAGKTTTLRMLTTLLTPTSGTATVAGYDLYREPVKVRQSIGYVSQSGSVSSEARAGDEIVDHGMLYGISRERALSRGRELFEQLDLAGMWQRQARTLSGGQRRRLDIAMGLVHDPKLVFLDEPTTGLDPQARANLWVHISDLRTKLGSTIFLTTHYLDEADALCDRIMVIDHGSIVASDTPEALKQAVAGDLIELAVSDVSQAAMAAERLSALATAAGTAASAADAATPHAHFAVPPAVEVDGLRVRMRVPQAATLLPRLLRSLDADGVLLASVDVRRPTLDDVFLNLTGRSLRDDNAA